MRSRPHVQVKLRPAVARPGDVLHVEVTLTSRSETPVDAVQVRFKSIETRPAGKGQLTHVHADLGGELELPGPVLHEGEVLVLPCEFQLPELLPPTFKGEVTRIEHRLSVRVDIPWWPDRVVQYPVRVRARRTEPRPTPRVFSNAPRGPKGRELTFEVALQNTELTPGGILEGAVSLGNAELNGVTSLEAELVAQDEPNEGIFGSPVPVSTFLPLPICATKPQSGVAYPFRFQLPDAAWPSFEGMLSKLVWRVQVRARAPFGSDATLSPVITIHDAEPPPVEARAPLPAPPLGAERRAAIWSEVAGLTALVFDAPAERLSGSFGAVSLSIFLELRKDRLWSVAELAWPDAGLEAALRERRWLDALKAGHPTQDPGFDARFFLSGRDPAQLLALLDRPVRDALPSFEAVELDDEGAALAKPDNGHTREGLERFVRAAIEMARLLDARLAAIPPPPALEATRAAWEEQAIRHGGRFRAGDFSIRGARYRDFDVELLTRFDGATPVATVARVRLAATPPEPLPAEAERVLGSLRAEVEGVRVTSDAVELILPCPLPYPERAELSWRSLQRLALAISPENRGGSAAARAESPSPT